MDGLFKEIYSKETNEATALILMLSVLSEKLTHIAELLDVANKLSTETRTMLQKAKDDAKTEIVFVETLSPEDYME